jgi:hypothetical protein
MGRSKSKNYTLFSPRRLTAAKPRHISEESIMKQLRMLDGLRVCDAAAHAIENIPRLIEDVTIRLTP